MNKFQVFFAALAADAIFASAVRLRSFHSIQDDEDKRGK
jgi:maleate cis-trans isomerase